jgi:acyl-coenzyme A thioesterase PaaI-like protein
MYAVTLSMIGKVELAVTTNLNINFLRKPAPRDVLAEARILKLGKRLAVSEVVLRSEGEADAVAHVTGTYSIPPRDD